MKRRWLAVCLALFFYEPMLSHPDPSSSGPAENDERKMEFGGSLKSEYSLFGARTNSAYYDLQYFGKDRPELLSSYPFTLYLNGDYDTGEIGVHVATATMVSGDSDPAFTIFELYGNFYFSDSVLLQSGKKIMRWGKGYAFNPVAYVSPAKDPEDPEASMEGYPLASFQYSRSFESAAMNNFTLDLVALPAGATASMKTGDAEDTVAAGKLYFLSWDTDVDFMVYFRKNGPFKSGFDFSRNITSGIEVHGEFSRFFDQPRYTIDGGTVRAEDVDGFSYLAGLRWLNEWNVTTIFEFYHDDAGLSKDEFDTYLKYLGNAAAGSASVVQALGVNRTYFTKANLMTDYLYIKISKPEPLDLVDVSISAFSVYNISDMSASLGLLIGYKPVTNLEIVFQPVYFFGSNDSEYGSKPYRYKAIFQAKFSF